jgi:hypothetical protein
MTSVDAHLPSPGLNGLWCAVAQERISGLVHPDSSRCMRSSTNYPPIVSSLPIQLKNPTADFWKAQSLFTQGIRLFSSTCDPSQVSQVRTCHSTIPPFRHRSNLPGILRRLDLPTVFCIRWPLSSTGQSPCLLPMQRVESRPPFKMRKPDWAALAWRIKCEDRSKRWAS